MAKSAQPKSTGIRTDDRLKNSRQFKGIRMRNWGKWVSEIRMPNSRARIWLGSYDTPEQAARAYDAAVYCLRGKKATFNFPDTPPEIPSALSPSPNQIQAAAARFAVAGFPSPSPSVNDSAEPLSPSPSVSSSSSPPSGSEIESPIEGEFWESLLADFQHSHFSNLDIFLPLNVSMSVLPFPSPSLKEGSFTFYQTDSWRDSWRL